MRREETTLRSICEPYPRPLMIITCTLSRGVCFGFERRVRSPHVSLIQTAVRACSPTTDRASFTRVQSRPRPVHVGCRCSSNSNSDAPQGFMATSALPARPPCCAYARRGGRDGPPAPGTAARPPGTALLPEWDGAGPSQVSDLERIESYQLGYTGVIHGYAPVTSN